jgi:hypothetical protein
MKCKLKTATTLRLALCALISFLSNRLDDINSRHAGGLGLRLQASAPVFLIATYAVEVKGGDDSKRFDIELHLNGRTSRRRTMAGLRNTFGHALPRNRATGAAVGSWCARCPLIAGSSKTGSSTSRILTVTASYRGRALWLILCGNCASYGQTARSKAKTARFSNPQLWHDFAGFASAGLSFDAVE